ncbi:hypothetical protein GCM10007164_06070 [Luteimonas padinae]|nr:hypothetical protein GCM10007164_06070 [Luteimonas padinae]
MMCLLLFEAQPEAAAWRDGRAESAAGKERKNSGRQAQECPAAAGCTQDVRLGWGVVGGACAKRVAKLRRMRSNRRQIAINSGEL